VRERTHGAARQAIKCPMRNIIIVTTFVIALPAAAADTRPHLCNPGEAAAWSCSTGSKIASLCASTNLSENEGTLIYRFGTRKKIELAYPGEGAKPQTSYIGGVTGYSGSGTDYIRFSIGEVTYTLYSDYYRGREMEGIAVERGEKLLSALRCRGGAVNPNEGWSRIYKAKLPRDETPWNTPAVR
jgi:hypothetical protein